MTLRRMPPASNKKKRKTSVRKKGKRWAVVVSAAAPGTKRQQASAPLRSSKIRKSSTKKTVAKRKKNATKKKPATQRSSTSSTGKSRVYVLELQGGYVYVGKTGRDVHKRLAEHMSSKTAFFKGSAFTRVHKPTGKLLKRLGNLEGDGDGPERDETLRQMFKRGPHMVRGWKYVRASAFRREELEDIESNIRELLDLCRRCGKKGHFATQCMESKDRSGSALGCSFRSR